MTIFYIFIEDYRPGMGNFDDGKGHYILTLTAEGHILCHTNVAKIADLQAQNASRCEAFWACRSAIFAIF